MDLLSQLISRWAGTQDELSDSRVKSAPLDQKNLEIFLILIRLGKWQLFKTAGFVIYVHEIQSCVLHSITQTELFHIHVSSWGPHSRTQGILMQFTSRANTRWNSSEHPLTYQNIGWCQICGKLNQGLLIIEQADLEGCKIPPSPMFSSQIGHGV